MQIISLPGNVVVSNEQWWFVVDNNKIIKLPNQCSGKISSPHTLFIGESEEECLQYIANNNFFV